MTLKKELGKRIQKLRLRQGLKQADLAEKVGIATKHQSCIETGKNFPSAELIEKFAIALHTDISEILNLERTKSSQEQLEDINKMLKQASEEEITIIYKVIKSLINC